MADPQQAIKARIRRASFEAQKAMDRLDATTIKQLESLYRQAAIDIQNRINSVPGDQIQLQDLQAVLSQVRQRLASLSQARNALLDGQMLSAAQLGVMPFASTFLDQQQVAGITNEALRFTRNFIAEDGLQLSDRIWRLDRHAEEVVGNAIEFAVVQGYGATQAAREFLSRGQPVPIEIQGKIDEANAAKIGKAAREQLFNEGSPMHNAMRLFRTELNRAHGEAYMSGAFAHPDAAGVKYLLSPAHPRPDICDLHARANLYGLGRGVYPSREKCPWPAHPNILSYLVVVFKDEVSEEDRAGKESIMEALGRLTPAQQIGVLGKNKYTVFQEGRLAPGMINSQWKSVKKRLGIESAPQRRPDPRPVPGHSSDPDRYIAAGMPISARLLAESAKGDGYDGATFLERLHDELAAKRPIKTPAKVQNEGDGARLVKLASTLFPDDWTKIADRHGPLWAVASPYRGGQVSLPKSSAGLRYDNLLGFSGIAKGGDGFIRAGNFSTALHEYAHRLQHALPGLDDIFQELHGRRTRSDKLEALKDLFVDSGYGIDEVTRKDGYRNAYQGKEYSNHHYLGKFGALEVMTMAFEDVLGGQAARLEELIAEDREMLDLVIGLLFEYVP